MMDVRAITITCIATVTLFRNSSCLIEKTSRTLSPSQILLYFLQQRIQMSPSRIFEEINKRSQSHEGRSRFASLVEAQRFMDSPLVETDVPTTADGLPWTCGCQMFWRDLGEDFYPRFVKDGHCITSTCWFGHFHCVPEHFELLVLRRMEATAALGVSDEILGDGFYFARVTITAECQCR